MEHKRALRLSKWSANTVRLRTATLICGVYAASMYGSSMLKTRMKRLAKDGQLAIKLLAEVQASVVCLADEDLLDLADIFKADPLKPLGAIAVTEMARRGISL